MFQSVDPYSYICEVLIDIAKISNVYKKSDYEKIGSSCRTEPNWIDALNLIVLALMRQENNEDHCQNGTFT